MAKFTDVFDDVTKCGRKLPTYKYKPSGAYPIIDQGKNQIAGYTNETEGLFTDVPVIIFGDHTRILKYVDKPFFLGADGVKVLKAKNQNSNYKFFYYALSSAKIPNTGYNRHFKWLKEVNIPSYSEREQVQIVSELDKVTALIDLRKEQLQKLDQLVKSRFIELFGEPLANTKGWQTECLFSVAPTKQVPFELTDRVWLLNLDAVESNTGTVLFKNLVSNNEINASTVMFSTDNVLYSKLRPYLNKVVLPDDKGFATSELLPLYPNNTKLNRAYLCYWLRSDAFVKRISEKVAGAKMPRVSMDYFRSIDIELPPLDLQNEFATFVEQTDKLKFEVKEALEKLETLKKTLMQQYFG